MKATAFPQFGPQEHGPHLPRNYQGHRTMKEAETLRAAEKARSKHPRVDALSGNNIRFSYQYAVEMTELAKRLEQELGQANARLEMLKTIGKAAHPAVKEPLRTPQQMHEAADSFAGLTNDEVYERLKRYRVFGMTTRA